MKTVKLHSPAKSVYLVEMRAGEIRSDGECDTTGTLYLNIGLMNGELIRAVLDQDTGDLLNIQTHSLGILPVKLFPIRMQNHEAVSKLLYLF